jgi:hypothetical protein
MYGTAKAMPFQNKWVSHQHERLRLSVKLPGKIALPLAQRLE